METEEHRELTAAIAEGTARIAVDADLARRFYVRQRTADIKAKTGRSEATGKAVVWGGLLVAPLLFVGFAIHVIAAYGAWAALLIPLGGIVWSVVAGLLNPSGSLATMSAVLLAAAAANYAEFPSADLALMLCIWTASLWVHRFTFRAAEFFLKRLLTASVEAFDELLPHVDIQRLGEPVDPPQNAS